MRGRAKGGVRASVIGQGGSKSKPTLLHELQGTRLHNGRKFEPKSNRDIGDPPDYMTEEEKAEWRYVVKIAPISLYSEADHKLLCNFVEASIRHKRCMVFFNAYHQTQFGKKYPYLCQNRFGDLMEHPLVKVLDKASSTLRMTGAELGLSPAARPKLLSYAPPTNEPKNEFERLRMERGEAKVAA